MSNETKVEFYLLRNSAERFASDLREFTKEVYSFSDEQLYGIASYCDHIKENMENVKREYDGRGTKC